MARLSLAQTLPPELLTRIFGWLVEIQVSEIPDGIVDPPFCLIAWPVTSRAPALRSSALVCRHWRFPAQEMLFRAIDITDAASEAIAFAFRQRPDLAEAVQAINAGRPTAESRCRDRLSLDIVSDLCPNVRHVYIASFPRTWKERLARFLASRELHTVISDGRRASVSERTDLGYLSMQDLSRLAIQPSIRNLMSLCTPHPAHVDPPLPIPPTPPATHLTTLAISISWKHSVAVQELLTSVASSLKFFDFYTETPVTFGNFGSALETLQTLEELRIYVGVSFGVENDQGWFKQVLPRLRSLKKVFITYDLAPPSIVLAAPASLEIFEYEWCGLSSEEMVDYIESFRKAFRQGKDRIPYRTFRLSLNPDEEEARLAPSTVTALSDACHARDVELDLTYWEETTGRRFPRESYISFF